MPSSISIGVANYGRLQLCPIARSLSVDTDKTLANLQTLSMKPHQNVGPPDLHRPSQPYNVRGTGTRSVSVARYVLRAFTSVDCVKTHKKDGYRQQNVRQRQKLISIIDYDVCILEYLQPFLRYSTSKNGLTFKSGHGVLQGGH